MTKISDEKRSSDYTRHTKGKEVVNKGFKKFLSVFLCVVMLFTLSSTALVFADNCDENCRHYCEIKFKAGCDPQINEGETTEIYVEYCAGRHAISEIRWKVYSVNGTVEYIKDAQTGLLTGVKIKSVSAGKFYIAADVVGVDGRTLASDMVTIDMEKPDNRTFAEKLTDWFDELPAKVWLGFFIFSEVALSVVVGPISFITGIFKH